jgi:hypothetical protein
MANFIPALGAAFAQGSTAAAASAGAAAAGAGATFSTLSTALSVASGLAAIGSGIAAMRRARTEAQFAEAQAAQEEANAASRAADIAREHEALRSEQTVIQLANGLDIGVGTPANVGESAKRAAERKISVTRENARNRSRLTRLRSRGLLAEGRASMLAGFGRAATIGVDALATTGT